MSDSQATVSELVATLLFLFVSSAKPLPSLSPARPRRRVFTCATLCSIVAQMAVHMLCIAAVRSFSLRLDAPRLFSSASPAEPVFDAGNLFLELETNFFGQKPLPAGSDRLSADFFSARNQLEKSFSAADEFLPSVGNTMGFHLAGAMSLATFAANYVGPPFVESVLANKRFLHTLLMGAAGQAALLFEFVPGASEYLQLVRLTKLREFPLFVALLAFSFVGAVLAERAVRMAFGEGRRIKCE